MSTIANLMVSLGLNSKEFEKGMDGAEKSSGRFRKGVGTVGKVVAGTAAAAAGLGVAAFAATKKVTEGFDNIAKSSTKLGVSTDAYQELDYWAGQNGLSTGSMERAVGRLNQRIGLAADGNEKYAGALTKVGVDMDAVRDGTITTEDAFAQSIQTLSEMTNEQEKSALASELFGTKLARDLMPALQDGSLSFEEAKQKAEELGIVIDGDTLAAAEEFQDTWDDVTRSLGAFGQKIFAELMPIFQSMMDWILANLPQIRAIFDTVFSFISEAISWVVEWIQSLMAFLDDWRSSNDDTLSSISGAFEHYLGLAIDIAKDVFTTLQEVVKIVFDFVVNFVNTALQNVYDFWKKYGADILSTAQSVFEDVRSVVETVLTTVWEIIQNILSRAADFISDILKKILAFWDENGEAIMQIVETVFSTIRRIIEDVMPIIQGIIEVAWGIIETVFDTALGIIMGLIETFIGLFTGDFEKMKDGITKIVESLWDGIRGIFASAWDLISGPLQDLWSMLEGWFSDLKNNAVDWGKNMIDGFIDGIKSMAGKVGEAVQGVIDSVADFMKFWSPAKKGEGRYITHWGRNMVDGFLDGVRDESSSASDVINDMIRNMRPGALDMRTLLPEEGYVNDMVARMPSSQKNKPNPRGGDNGSSGKGDINQYITVNSPKHLSESDLQRKYKQSARELALEWELDE
ncbi:hypothetical protein FLK61_35120 [Paenalkalicoccus suaedae]|uniref:Phage tail tape measure protein n=1 Tax=Paenalkalicoccus suaedae TaxID=2592382 RepID=A0A859FFV6_9BACI|nr:hypothetical protein [Paenalkalicoccus suaedae]QKS71901.1 hypothetical protein FLK61_35120 [Paenalkalicoccus suaedae]